MTTSSLAARFRQVFAEHGHGALGGSDLAEALAQAAVAALSAPLELVDQYSYVESWCDGSGVHERVTFSSLAAAQQYLRDNASDVADLNSEVEPVDRVVASIERRLTATPGPWEPVQSPTLAPEPEWEYGFVADGGEPIWYCFGLPLTTAEEAERIGQKNYWETLAIVRRAPGSAEYEPIPEAGDGDVQA